MGVFILKDINMNVVTPRNKIDIPAIRDKLRVAKRSIWNGLSMLAIQDLEEIIDELGEIQ